MGVCVLADIFVSVTAKNGFAIIMMSSRAALGFGADGGYIMGGGGRGTCVRS